MPCFNASKISSRVKLRFHVRQDRVDSVEVLASNAYGCIPVCGVVAVTLVPGGRCDLTVNSDPLHVDERGRIVQDVLSNNYYDVELVED